jgi:hypothetical protein
MAAATFERIVRPPLRMVEATAGDKPTTGIHIGDQYTDLSGVVWVWNGALWIQIATATFGGTVATVDQGNPGAQSWPVVVDGWSFAHIVLAAPTTTTVKGSAGVLHSLTINTPVATAVVAILDNATPIGTITLPAALLSDGPRSAIYDVAFGASLKITTSVAACDLTVAYR